MVEYIGIYKTAAINKPKLFKQSNRRTDKQKNRGSGGRVMYQASYPKTFSVKRFSVLPFFCFL